jgi:hypothetical protein
MKPAKFELARAGSVAEAAAVLRQAIAGQDRANVD